MGLCAEASLPPAHPLGAPPPSSEGGKIKRRTKAARAWAFNLSGVVWKGLRGRKEIPRCARNDRGKSYWREWTHGNAQEFERKRGNSPGKFV